ncbi:MAG: LCP family protein [Spirochaetes bacterium]|nr:LCP family protein [Spirochaetota bacterium]
MSSRKSMKSNNNLLGIIMLVFIILLIIATIFASRYFTSENKIKQIFENGSNLSFFIVITNENKKVTNSVVLFYNTKTNRISVTYILPKTYIKFNKFGFSTIENIFVNKINHEEILNGVGKLLNQKISHYLFLKDKNFIRFVDMIGGVEIYTNEVTLPSNNIFYPSGLFHLDGDSALQYIQVQLKDENAYNQLKRMSNFFRGLLRIKNDFKENYTHEIISNYIYKLFETNLLVNDSLIIYQEIQNRFEKDIKDYSENMINIILYGDKKLVENDYVYLPKNNGNWIRSEVKDALSILEKSDISVSANKPIVQILNGTNSDGLAARTKRYLESFGFDVINIANANRNDYENTLVVIRNSEPNARKLASLIRCQRIVRDESDESGNYDVTLILGTDFDGKFVRN